VENSNQEATSVNEQQGHGNQTSARTGEPDSSNNMNGLATIVSSTRSVLSQGFVVVEDGSSQCDGFNPTANCSLGPRVPTTMIIEEDSRIEQACGIDALVDGSDSTRSVVNAGKEVFETLEAGPLGFDGNNPDMLLELMNLLRQSVESEKCFRGQTRFIAQLEWLLKIPRHLTGNESAADSTKVSPPKLPGNVRSGTYTYQGQEYHVDVMTDTYYSGSFRQELEGNDGKPSESHCFERGGMTPDASRPPVGPNRSMCSSGGRQDRRLAHRMIKDSPCGPSYLDTEMLLETMGIMIKLKKLLTDG